MMFMTWREPSIRLKNRGFKLRFVTSRVLSIRLRNRGFKMRLMTWRALSMSPYRAGPAPDPERWLPLRERQSYRGKRKKTIQIRGAQGSANMSADLKTKEFGGAGMGGGGGGGGGGKGKGPAVEAGLGATPPTDLHFKVSHQKVNSDLLLLGLFRVS